MARVCTLLLSGLVLVVGLTPKSGAQTPQRLQTEQKPLPQVNIGLPKVLFRDVHPDLVAIAAQPFKDTIQKTAGLNGHLVMVEDYKTIVARLNAKTLDIALFHGFEYAWIKDANPDLIPLVVTVPNCGRVQACLVVNVTRNIKEPKDLKGSCIAIHKGLKAHCQMFLDQLRKDLPEGCCCPMKNTGATPDEVLDDVAGGTCSAALVDISSFLAYNNSKPGLGSWLKVLTSSDPLPSAVVVCRKGALTDTQVQAIRTDLVACNKSVQGRLFLSFWNLKAFTVPAQDYFTLVEKCKEAHPEPKLP